MHFEASPPKYIKLETRSSSFGMEIELGLKITRDGDDQNSTDFHIAKDRAGPVFMSTETDSVFILSAHLKGFEKENIKININDDGTRITISGEKVVSETIVRGWRVYKKEDEVRGFRKTFKIPDGVVLDGIRAKFGAEKSSLTIYMPKSEKGIRGHDIEEVEEKERTATRGSEVNSEEKKEVFNEAVPKATNGSEDRELKSQEKKADSDEAKRGNADVDGSTSNQKPSPGAPAEKSIAKEGEGDVEQKKAAAGLSGPSLFMGSALIASLLVLVVGFVRAKTR